MFIALSDETVTNIIDGLLKYPFPPEMEIVSGPRKDRIKGVSYTQGNLECNWMSDVNSAIWFGTCYSTVMVTEAVVDLVDGHKNFRMDSGGIWCAQTSITVQPGAKLVMFVEHVARTSMALLAMVAETEKLMSAVIDGEVTCDQAYQLQTMDTLHAGSS